MKAAAAGGEAGGCIEPFYFKGERGRKPVGLERMLRSTSYNNGYALADEALEDSL